MRSTPLAASHSSTHPDCLLPLLCRLGRWGMLHVLMLDTLLHYMLGIRKQPLHTATATVAATPPHHDASCCCLLLPLLQLPHVPLPAAATTCYSCLKAQPRRCLLLLLLVLRRDCHGHHSPLAAALVQSRREPWPPGRSGAPAGQHSTAQPGTAT
jgi:hypothetical protein